MKTGLKRVCIWVAAVVMVAALLAGCGGNQAPAPATTSKPAPAVTSTPSPTAKTPAATSSTKNVVPPMIPNVKMPVTMIFLGGSSPVSVYHMYLQVFQLVATQRWSVASRLELSNATANLQRVDKGEADLGAAMANNAYGALKGGTKSFPEPLTNLRTLTTNTMANSIAVFVLKNSPLKDISELNNKRIFGGSAGSFSVTLAEVMLKGGYGFGFDDIKKAGGLVHIAPIPDGVDMLAAGNLDAVIQLQTAPFAEMSAVDLTKGVRLLPWNEKAIAAALALPGVSNSVVPKGVYSGLLQAYPSVTGPQVIFANKNMPDDVVFNLLAAAYEGNGAKFQAMGALYKDLDHIQIALEKPILPFHPGAEKFWNEVRKLRGP